MGTRRAAAGTAVVPMSVEIASARAAVYRLLAEATAYPDAESVALVRGPYLDAALWAASGIDRPTAAAVRAVRRALAELTVEAAERAFVSTFGHARPQRAVPFECPYVTTNLFQESDVLADIAGFYRAFGVEPASGRAERQDHIVLELEFMHLLAAKAAHAIERGAEEWIEIAREAQRSFFSAHLARWAARFFRLLGEPGAPAHYAAIARLAEAFLRSESALLGSALELAPRPVLLPDDVDASCPLATDGAP